MVYAATLCEINPKIQLRGMVILFGCLVIPLRGLSVVLRQPHLPALIEAPKSKLRFSFACCRISLTTFDSRSKPDYAFQYAD